MSCRMVRVEGIEVDWGVGSHLGRKGRGKSGTLGGFRAPPSIWRFRLAALGGTGEAPVAT